jgi:hypothetical protein
MKDTVTGRLMYIDIHNISNMDLVFETLVKDKVVPVLN